MSKSRSPSKRKSDAAGSGLVPTPSAPTGILPPSLARGDTDDDAVEMLIQTFVDIYPGINDIGELDKGERSAWLRLRNGLLRGNKAAIEVAKGVERMLQKQVDAEILDRNERRAEELKDATARRKRENQSHAQELEMRREEHEQTLAERRVRSANQSLRERLVLGMTAISFGCLVASLLFVFLSGPQVVSGSSALFFGAVSIMGILRTLIFKREKEEEEGRASPHASQ
jgi:hypothetical protein